MKYRHKDSVEIDKLFLVNAAKQLGLTANGLAKKLGRCDSWGTNVKQRGYIKLSDKNRIEALLAGHQLPVPVAEKRRKENAPAPHMPGVGEPQLTRYIVLTFSEAEAAALRGILAMAKFQFEEETH